MTSKPDLRVDIGGLQLQNPVMTASGTFGYAREFEHLVDLNRLGAIIVKGLSLEPTKGNPPPRISETPCGMLNAIGLENVGIEAFVKDKLPFLQTLTPPLIVNIYGKREDDYTRLAARIEETEGIDGIEVNISCPNVKAGGMAFGVDPLAAFSVIRAVREQTRKFLAVKLSLRLFRLHLRFQKTFKGRQVPGSSVSSLMKALVLLMLKPSTPSSMHLSV